jgi:hypothetical protein
MAPGYPAVAQPVPPGRKTENAASEKEPEQMELFAPYGNDHLSSLGVTRGPKASGL